MQSEEQFYPTLLNWAEKFDIIRVVLQTSSRTNPHAFKDQFTDYDIELFVDEVEWFLQDEWLSLFGKLIAVAPLKPVSEKNHLTRLVLFEDGTKIDFQIQSIHSLQKLHTLPPEYDNGYQVLLDKDNLTTTFKAPSHKAYNVAPPRKEAYMELVNSFWWDTSYVAKSLWRDELFFAKYMFESIIRINYLRPMIEWHLGVQYDWAVNPNKFGRWFKRYLDPVIWIEIEQTYAGADREKNWQALFNMMDLFRKLAVEVGQSLGYDYDQEMDDHLTTYCKNIHKLEAKREEI